MKVESFVFYTSWLEAIKELDREDQLDALLSIMYYQAYHIEASDELTGPAKAIYYMAKPVADNLYQRRVTNAENGKKGGRPKSTKSNEELQDKVTKGNPKKNRNKTETKPIGYSEKNLYENDNDNENENDNENDKSNRRFAKPTIDEVISYCEERNNDVDPQRWYAYYESNGWRVGKNPMKDWQACVRTWERNESPKKPTELPTYDTSKNQTMSQERMDELAKRIGL